MSTALVVEERRGREALASLRDEWRSLHERSRLVPFLSWEWLDAWWRALAPERTPRILLAREEGRLVGLLALGEELVRPVGPAADVRRLSFLGERWAGADYLDVLAEKGREAEVAECLYGALAKAGDFDVLDLDDVAADSPSVPLIARLFSEGRFRHALTPRYTCPQVALEGTWKDVLKRSKRGDNFKRRLRQLRELEGFERRVVRDPEEAVAAYDRFLELHEKRWSVQGGSDAMGRPAIQEFHRDVVRRLADAGRIRFEEIWAEGSCRASIYGIDAGETYCFYQSGYDPEWAKRSVGLVCLGLSIEDALSRGVKVYDFLRGTESYKYDWSIGTRETVGIRVMARGVASTLLLAREAAEAAARAAAHAILPAAAVDLLRRLRRARERQSNTIGG